MHFWENQLWIRCVFVLFPACLKGVSLNFFQNNLISLKCKKLPSNCTARDRLSCGMKMEENDSFIRSSVTLKMTIFMTWQASKWRFWVDFENDLKLAQNKIFPKTKSIVVHCIRRSTTEKKLRVKIFWVVKSIGGFYRDSLLSWKL